MIPSMTAEEMEAIKEAALLPIRRALFLRGHCGDGGLTAMVIRALEEAQERGRAENREVLAALLEASDALPPEMEGTVAARVRQLTAELARVRAVVAEVEKWRRYIQKQPGVPAPYERALVDAIDAMDDEPDTATTAMRGEEES